MKNIKLVFLDIDGVLNSFNSDNEHDFTPAGLFSKGILWLEEIYEKTEAQVVICSTWRGAYSINYFKGMFAAKGWFRPKIYGLTPKLSSAFRGSEVEAYIRNLYELDISVYSYVIFDDGSDYFDYQPLIHIDGQIGIQETHIDKALMMLGTENRKENREWKKLSLI